MPTSRTRSRRSAACTSASLDEAKLRVLGTLVVTGLALAYIIWKIDIRQTLRTSSRDASRWWFFLAAAIMLVTVVPMAWRWQRLLEAHGMHERVPWLTRAYFVAYTAGQILPDLDRRRRDADLRDLAPASRERWCDRGIVLLERALGGAATLAARRDRVRARDRPLRRRRLPLDRGAFVVGTFVLAVMLFSRSARPLLRALGAAAPAHPARAARARGLRRRSILPRHTAAARRGVRAHARDPVRARARDLGGRARPSASTSPRASTT